ncbi:thiosulfate sulfurtransferase/rhodanese-like domain-containing protein 3 [Trichomycterus rosablanca]|uniref:thiosulfate sulfurtransferase/rhodanese-like domain-containing protein 3 n=1 Tax=Trichomycterus rosablanca TaxID=2290929 RepID=UPI002F356F32
MALNICCRLTRCVLRALDRRNVATRALASHPLCLQNQRAVDRTTIWMRSFSSESAAVIITHEQLKKLLVGRSGVLIDVREPWELREFGSIPGSINVPLGQVTGALQLNPEEFKEKYGGEMPSVTENIVFTCLAGVRSQKALDAAIALGYSNVRHYPGGWKDWAEHEILQTKE